jgi:hypothetical protein
MTPPQTSTTTSTTKHRRSKPRIGQRLKIIQHQVGHRHASTTALYTCVSSDYRTKTLRNALNSVLREALNTGTEAADQ